MSITPHLPFYKSKPCGVIEKYKGTKNGKYYWINLLLTLHFLDIPSLDMKKFNMRTIDEYFKNKCQEPETDYTDKKENQLTYFRSNEIFHLSFLLKGLTGK